MALVFKFKSKVLGLAALVAASLSSCSSPDSISSLNGLPSVDADLARMRWHFSLAKPVTSIDQLKPGSEWKCVQRTALARSTHTSYFTRSFTKTPDGRAVIGKAKFDILPTPAVSSGKFYVAGDGRVKGMQTTDTDRYQLAYEEQASVYFRLYEGSTKLIEEWAAPQASTITGRGFAFLPELVILDGQTLMEPAFTNPALGAFLYASCDLVVRR